MKMKYEFVVREICDEYVLVPVGVAALEFGGMISTNEIGAFLWKLMQDEFTVDSLTAQVVEQFDVEEETARQDVLEFIESAKAQNLIEE